MQKDIFVVAGAIIKDNKVYCARRGNSGLTAFKFEFPGGKNNPGESDKDALIRELKEELDITVAVHELLTSIVDIHGDVSLHIATYRCSLLEGIPKIKEHIEDKWASKEELMNLDFSKADFETLKLIHDKYLK